MLLGIGNMASATAGEANLTHTARTTAKGKAITPRNASSCAESLKDTMANPKSTCIRGDSGHTQPDAEEGAVRTANIGSNRTAAWTISQRTAARTLGGLSLRHRKHGILGVGGSNGALVNPTGGGVRIWARGLRKELWREPLRRGWRQVRLRPSSRRLGLISTGAGDHRR